MATIQTLYLGDLRTEAEHLGSKTKILTDAPIDNKGKGEAFSPTDLLAASLGSCMLTIMGIAAREHGMDIAGTQMEITKVMQNNPRKVSEIQVIINLPQKAYSEKDIDILQRSALTCPVYLSLHPDLKKTLKIISPTVISGS